MINFYDANNAPVSAGINFGRVRLGESVEVLIYAKNEGKFPLIDLTFAADNPEVQILSAPRNLKVGCSEAMKLKWGPAVNSEFGLKCRVTWLGDELRGEE